MKMIRLDNFFQKFFCGIQYIILKGGIGTPYSEIRDS